METHWLNRQHDLLGMHPADLADELQRMEVAEAREVIHRLPPEKVAAVIAELSPERARELLPGITDEKLGDILERLPHEEAADIAQGLPEERQGPALAAMAPEHSRIVTDLMRYGKDTAGGIMTDRFIALEADKTIGETMDALRGRNEAEFGDITYLYATDSHRKLLGVISLRDLVFRDPKRKVSDFMNRDVKFLWADADQEEIARQFEHYHYMGLPVLERDGRLVGVVRGADLIGVAQEEATEDMQLMVGISGEERALTPWQKSIGRRLPWLLVNLATAFVAAAVVSLFETTIAQWTVLAVFLPIVAGQGGNAGVQTLTVIIRDLALREITMKDARGVLGKEMMLGLMNGLAVGVVVGVGGYLWKNDWRLGLIVGMAMVLNMLAAAASGVLIPYGLKAMRVDPALASSIFLTTVTDVAGFFFFLGLAAIGLKLAGL